MNRRFNIDPLYHVLTTDKARAIVIRERAIQKTVTRVKTFSRVWSLVKCFIEIGAGIFAVFYLIASLALGGALLFFTFFH